MRCSVVIELRTVPRRHVVGTLTLLVVSYTQLFVVFTTLHCCNIIYLQHGSVVDRMTSL